MTQSSTIGLQDDAAILAHDPETLAELLAASVPLRDLDAIGPRQAFWHRSIAVQCESLHFVAGCHSPLYGSVEATDRATVMVTLEGSAQFRCQKQILNATGTLTTLFLPGEEYRGQTDHYNGIIFSVDQNRLARTASAIAGRHEPTTLITQALSSCHQLRQDQPQHRDALQNLYQTINLMNTTVASNPVLLSALGIDDVIYRCLALLLVPALGEQSEDSKDRQDRSSKLAQIEDYLMANLERTCNVTELEQRFSISKRTLQSWFRERHDCGPIQWHRRQRLYAARDQLLQADTESSTIEQIGNNLGYTNITCFSRDFKQVFKLSPSQVLKKRS
jgi:AraC-like DNA-binding protein